MPSNERSAEFCRGAVAVLGRMVDECSTVFDSDLPHITQGNLEDYLAEYADLLAAAEVREAIPGDILSTTVEKLREACSGVRVQPPEQEEPSAAEVIEAAWWALQPFARGGVIDCLSRDDYSVMKERIVDWHGPSDFRAAVAAADLCARWKEANGGK